jgi:poly-gamma-glutamate synthesis protein (capsule biosynthesis protein)
MKGKILIFIFLGLFLFCASQIFKPEVAPASVSSSIENQEIPKTEEYKPERIIFVGDMMFDRGVERLMQQSTFSYPVDIIKDFLNSFDFAVGNLEGPINEKPKEFSDGSLMFSFDKKSVQSLIDGNFSLVSLANNHTLNMERTGLEETKSILKENNISFAGDPLECDGDYSYQKDGITYYAVNVTFSNNCSNKQIATAIENLKFYNPETFLIVLVHWGTEYQTTNSKEQQTLAHLMIDSGADLIIGGHPHVVQNVEQYNNKLIFYSLGNFIFDQYFSKETQEGLGVGIEIYKDKKLYAFYPIVNKSSQPKLMEDAEKIDFLNALAESSSDVLKESIKNGKIEIKN